MAVSLSGQCTETKVNTFGVIKSHVRRHLATRGRNDRTGRTGSRNALLCGVAVGPRRKFTASRRVNARVAFISPRNDLHFRGYNNNIIVFRPPLAKWSCFFNGHVYLQMPRPKTSRWRSGTRNSSIRNRRERDYRKQKKNRNRNRNSCTLFGLEKTKDGFGQKAAE